MRSLLLLLACAIAAPTLSAQLQSSIGSSRPHSILPLPNRVLMAANDGFTGMELWEWNTSIGATQLANLHPDGAGVRGSYPDELTSLIPTLGGPVLFSAATTAEGRELWVWDGVSAQILPIQPGLGDSNPLALTSAGGRVFLTAIANPLTGRRLFVSDGLTVGAVATAATLADPYGLFSGANRLLFSATSGGVTEAFALDPSTLVVTALRPVSNVPTYLDPGPFVQTTSGIYFAATVAGNRRLVLWDAVNPPQLVTFPGGTDVHPDALTSGGFELAVRARAGSGAQLHLVSGTLARAVTSFTASAAATISNVTGSVNGFWFSARTGGTSELWYVSNFGTAAAALPAIVGSGDAFPRLFHTAGSGIVFAADDIDGVEPWRATTTGVAKTGDLRSGVLDAGPGGYATGLFFGDWFAAQGANGRELWRDTGGAPVEVDINRATPSVVDAHIEPLGDQALQAELTLAGEPNGFGALLVTDQPPTPFALPGLVTGLVLTLSPNTAVINVPSPPSGVAKAVVTFGPYTGPCGSPAVIVTQYVGGISPPFDVSDPTTIVQGCATIGSARIDTFGSYDDKTGEYKIRVQRNVTSPTTPVHYLALAKKITKTGELVLVGSKAIADGETLWLEGEIDLQLPISINDPPGNRLYLLFVPTPPTQQNIQTYSSTALGWFSYC